MTEYVPMFPKEEKQEKDSHIKDFDAWIERKLVEGKYILDALGRQ